MPIISVDIMKIIDERETQKKNNKKKQQKTKTERTRGTKAIVKR